MISIKISKKQLLAFLKIETVLQEALEYKRKLFMLKTFNTSDYSSGLLSKYEFLENERSHVILLFESVFEINRFSYKENPETLIPALESRLSLFENLDMSNADPLFMRSYFIMKTFYLRAKRDYKSLSTLSKKTCKYFQNLEGNHSLSVEYFSNLENTRKQLA